MADEPIAVQTAGSGIQQELGELDNALFRKMAWRIMPLLILAHILNWIDRINIGFAHLGFQKDLGITEAAFGIMVGVYSIGHLACEIPSNLLLQKIGAKKTLMRITILWGSITMLTAFATKATHFYIIRILLGAAEGGLFPGIILYMTYWFPTRYRARITSRFYIANATAGIIGGPISVFIMTRFAGLGGLHGWQWLFVMEGIPTILLGVVIYFFLDNKPQDAKWLTAAEKNKVLTALQNDRLRYRNVRHHGLKDALKDHKIYLMAIAFCLTIMATGNVVNVWAPSIIRHAGVSLSRLGALSSVPYIVGVICMFLVSRHSDLKLERRWHFAIAGLVSAAGMVLLSAATKNWVLAIGALIITTSSYLISMSMFWTIPSGYLSESARAGGLALVNTLGQVGGLITPIWIGWVKTSTGNLNLALYVVAAAVALGAMTIVLGIPSKTMRSLG